MGWTSFKTRETLDEVFKREFGNSGYEIITYNKTNEPHSGTDEKGRNAVFYAAVRHPKGYVLGLVVLMTKVDGEVYYKDMDESEGPCYHNASSKVMNALTPLEKMPYQSENGKEWRNHCKNNSHATTC